MFFSILFQAVSEENDQLRSEVRQLRQDLNQPVETEDAVFTEHSEFLLSSPSHFDSSFISESISPDQEWSCSNSACQKLFQNFRDLSDRAENIGFEAPGSGRSNISTSGSTFLTEDRNVEQGFKPEMLILSSGDDRSLEQGSFSLESGTSEVLRREIVDGGKDVSYVSSDKPACTQGFQPENVEEIFEIKQEGEYLLENGNMDHKFNPENHGFNTDEHGFNPDEHGFNPEEEESFKEIRDKDLQASRLSLNLDSGWESHLVQRSFSEDPPPQFSPEVRKLKVYPASAPIGQQPNEGFIPSEAQQDQDDSDDSMDERIPVEKLLRIKESELQLLKNKIEEMMEEKSELTERCLALNTQVENELLLRQGLEQELNSLVVDLSSTGPEARSNQEVGNPGEENREESERMCPSSSREDLENRMKSLGHLYEKEKQQREELELELNTEKLYRKELEEELKSRREDHSSPLSAGLQLPGRHSSGRHLTRRQFSYEAEDVGQRSGDTPSVLSLFCSEHYKEMASKVNQLQFQNDFLSEKIRIVESLNNGERKSLAERIRKLESELNELRQGSVFVEEDEEIVVEDVTVKSSSGPDFLMEDRVQQSMKQGADGGGEEGKVDDVKVEKRQKEEDEEVTEGQKKEMEDNLLRELLEHCQRDVEILRKDNLSLQLEMAEKNDFLGNVEKKTKELVTQLKSAQSECQENQQKLEKIRRHCQENEEALKEKSEELTTLKDRMIEEEDRNKVLYNKQQKLREGDIGYADCECQTESSGLGFVKKGGRSVDSLETRKQNSTDQVEMKYRQTEENEVSSTDRKTNEQIRAQVAETQAGLVSVATENKGAQTESAELNDGVLQKELDSVRGRLQEKEQLLNRLEQELDSVRSEMEEKEELIKRLEEELDQDNSSGGNEDQDFEEYRERMDRALKEKETYIRKLEEHLLGRQTPERNLKSLPQKPRVDAAQVGEIVGHQPKTEAEDHHQVADLPLKEDQKEVDIQGRINPLLPWHSPLDDESEPSNYSARSTSHLETSASIPEAVPACTRPFSPSLSVSSRSSASTFSVGSWDPGAERIVSGLGPEDDGHKALEQKHFELIDEISLLRKDLKETKSIYTQENALLQEALDREKWMSGNLRSKLGMTNTVVNFDLSAELVSLRQKVSILQETNKMLQAENDRWMQRLQEQERLVLELKGRLNTNEGSTDRDEVFSQQVALLQQHRQELIDRLKERELDNSKLSSQLGDHMILEENLRREKDLLKVKLSERESIENELHEKKMELQRQIGYQRKLEDIIYHKNLIEKELMKQKRLLEMDFIEIESKLQEKEELLEIQRNQLLRELKMKDQILALGSEGGSEVTGSRVQSPSLSEASSNPGSRSLSVDLGPSRSSRRESGRMGVMLSEAERDHLLAVDLLKDKLRTRSYQNLPLEDKLRTGSQQNLPLSEAKHREPRPTAPNHPDNAGATKQ